MVCREVEGDWPRCEPKGVVEALGRASGLPTAPDLAFFFLFFLDQGCGARHGRVQKSRARFWMTESTLI